MCHDKQSPGLPLHHNWRTVAAHHGGKDGRLLLDLDDKNRSYWGVHERIRSSNPLSGHRSPTHHRDCECRRYLRLCCLVMMWQLEQTSTTTTSSSPGATPPATTTPPPNPTETHTPPPGPALSTGAKAGIGVGAALAVCIGLVLLWLGWRCAKRLLLPSSHVAEREAKGDSDPRKIDGGIWFPEIQGSGLSEAPGNNLHHEVEGHQIAHTHELEGRGR